MTGAYANPGLVQRLQQWAETTPDADAVIFGERRLTFADLNGRASRLSSWLVTERGISAGDRVSYLGINHPVMLELVFACARLGAIFSPMNSRLALAEYRYLISDAEPKVCIFDQNFSDVADDLKTGSDCNFVPIENLAELPDAVTPIDLIDDGSSPLLLVYTSGTTGRPKGVVLTQDAVLANIENCQSLYDFSPGQKVLINLPLFHVGGLCILLLPALTNGATIILHDRFDPVRTLQTLMADGITTTILVPAQMSAMMALEDWKEARFPSLNYLVVGSSIIPMQQIRAWHAKGIPVSQVYGATETGPAAIALRLADCTSHEGSAGTKVKLCDIAIRQSDGTAQVDGDAGEVWVRGPNVMQGYWRSPSETAAVLQDGWYNTGDIGYRDAEGFCWIVDRSKDMIISGGENIYPAEVEAVSMEHSAIAAIAMVGRPDPRWGETPVAYIELAPGAKLNSEEYLDFLQDKIARYKQPKAVIFIDEMPRNGMGKIEKSVLRELARNT